MNELTCIGEPISWLRLERHALASRPDRGVDDHLAACPACARCLADIRGSQIELPRLVVPATAPRRERRPWLRWVVPATALAAAALIALVVIPRRDSDGGGGDEWLEGPKVRVKGVGVVELGLVRERDGTIRNDVETYAPGDRFKVVVTCPPEGDVWIDVEVRDNGAIDRPLAPAHTGCGNRVVVPGAFSITGDRPNQICIRIASEGAPQRDRRVPTACVTVTRE